MTERGKLTGKVALVTGAGSGIGEATARLFATEGATAIVSDVCEEAAEKVAQVICDGGGTTEAVALDVTQEKEWEAVLGGLVDRHGRLDILVNNAGISISKPIAELDFEQWRRVLAVNLDGVFLGTKYAINAMSGGGGSIVNVASVSGMIASAGASNYCASKSAVRMFSRTAAIECADAGSGIRVNLVTPGGVKTPMWEREEFFQAMVDELGDSQAAFAKLSGGVASQQFFAPEDVAKTILYLASDDAAHLTGTEIILDRHCG